MLTSWTRQGHRIFNFEVHEGQVTGAMMSDEDPFGHGGCMDESLGRVSTAAAAAAESNVSLIP